MPHRRRVPARPSSPILLRGDSTLRAHLLAEYLGLRDAAAGGRDVPMLLVPALPAAGRITIDGVHLVEQAGQRIPLHDTAYARDPSFAYAEARLVQWADDRSGGYFDRTAGVEIASDELRAEGHAGNTATDHVAPPSTASGLLVVCGSYVATSTRQLAKLVAARPGALIEVDVLALAGPEPEAEIERAAHAAQTRLAATGLAIVATPRDRPAETASLHAGQRIARSLARVLLAIDPYPGVVLAKGGITSHVTASDSRPTAQMS